MLLFTSGPSWFASKRGKKIQEGEQDREFENLKSKRYIGQKKLNYRMVLLK